MGYSPWEKVMADSPNGLDQRVERRATVPAALAGRRFDQIAATLFGEFSRSRLKSWIVAGDLQVNAQPRQPRAKLQMGDELQLQVILQVEGDWQAQDIELPIIYQDEALLVVDKSAGLVVHPAAGHRDGTVLNALLHHCPDLAQLPRAGIVHRLDKDTTGLMVVARQLSSHADLVAQLQARTVKRQYLALVNGVPRAGGTVNAPLGRHPVQRKQMAVVARGGKEAITHYRVIERFAAHSLLKLDLETGRTHQIRVHMAHLGYPLLGDPVYGGRLKLPPGCTDDLRLALRGFKRQALHAWRLGLVHPHTSQPMQWQVAMPDDMLTMLRLLRGEGGLPDQRLGEDASHE
jgi:23S rRNA pseudouridine1911/1915/1917 synthase